MYTKVQKWGNSLAVRIPRSFAVEIGIEQDSDVELALADGKLVLSPTLSQPPTLAALLQGITDSNIHAEVDSGDAVGSESW